MAARRVQSVIVPSTVRHPGCHANVAPPGQGPPPLKNSLCFLLFHLRTPPPKASFFPKTLLFWDLRTAPFSRGKVSLRGLGCWAAECTEIARLRLLSAIERYPKGTKIENIQDLRPGLKFSSERVNYRRATHQGRFLCLWGISKDQD